MFAYSSRSSDAINNFWFYHTATWTLKRCWLPRYCELTGRNLWLRKAYLGRVEHEHIGSLEYRWHDRYQHLLWLLKGN